MKSISAGSYWCATSPSGITYPPLTADTQTDIAIIGGGITGLTLALLLKNAGRRVLLLEAGRIGSGTTGGTSAHLEAMPDQGVDVLIEDHGEENARLVTQGRLAAIDQIESWCDEYGIDCKFARIPGYSYSEWPDGADKLIAQCDAAMRIGLHAQAVRKIDLPFPTEGGLRIERQARFHPLRYIHGLAERFHGDGCAIHEQTRAQPPEDGTPCRIATQGGEVTAQEVVLCTHSAFLGISELDMRVAPYQSYIITVNTTDGLPDALYWDDASPYNYLRQVKGGNPRLVMIGGADHKTGHGGHELDSFAQLEAYARKRFQVESVEHRWSAEFFEPSDGLPFIGRVPFKKHLYVATGFSGTGLTFGTLAGRLLADVLLDLSSVLCDVLSPSRFKPMAAMGTLLKENLDVAKRFVMDRLGPRRVESLDEVPPGEGELVKFNGQALAVYREKDGTTHTLSPVCTHAGCYVQWNASEKTWDCPCHGGRYAPNGERIYGPPSRDLEYKQAAQPDVVLNPPGS